MVSPPRLLTGHDLMETFAIKPGKRLGRLLEAIREAQAEGLITSPDQALAYARSWLEQEIPSDEP